mgnify:FL=1
MAEDFKIKVKVEPSATGLQGKLDNIAKDKTLNVNLFDEGKLQAQINRVQKLLNSMIVDTSNQMSGLLTDSMRMTGQANGVMQALADSLGVVTKKQQEQSAVAKTEVFVDQAKVKEAENRLSSLIDKLKMLEEEGRAAPKSFQGLFNEAFDEKVSGSFDNVKKNILRDINALKKALKEFSADGLKPSDVYDIGLDIQDIVNGETSGSKVVSWMQDFFVDLDKGMDDFEKKYSEKFVHIKKLIDEKVLDSKKALSDSAFDLQSDRGYLADLLDADEIDKQELTNTLKDYIDSYQEFIDATGYLQGEREVNVDNKTAEQIEAINQVKKQIREAEAELESAKKGVIRIVAETGKEAGKALEDETTKAASAAGEKARKTFADKIKGEVTTKSLYGDVSAESFEKNIESLKEQLGNALSGESNTEKVKKFRKDIFDLLSEFNVQGEKLLGNVDISKLDTESASLVSHLRNVVTGSKNAREELSQLFSEIKDKPVSASQYEKFENIVSRLQGYMKDVSASYKNLDELTIGTPEIANGDDDTIATKLAETEKAMKRLIQLQVDLNVEKNKTIEAEGSIAQKAEDTAQKINDVLRLQDKLNGTMDKTKSSDIKQDDITDFLKSLDDDKLRASLKTIQDFISAMAKQTASVEKIKSKFNEMNAQLNATPKAINTFISDIERVKVAMMADHEYFDKIAGSQTQNTGSDKKKSETEQQASARLTTLVNKAQKSADSVIEAVSKADEAIKAITKALTDSAMSATAMKKATPPILEAALSLAWVFDTYKQALENANGLLAETKGKETTTPKTTVDSKATSKSIADISTATDGVSELFAKFNKIAKATNNFSEKSSKIINAANEINGILTAYKGIGTQASEQVRQTAEEQQSIVFDLQKGIGNISDQANTAKEKVDNATKALHTAATSAGTLDADVQALILAGRNLSKLFKNYATIANGMQNTLSALTVEDATAATNSLKRLKAFITKAGTLYVTANTTANKVVDDAEKKKASAKEPVLDAKVVQAAQEFKDAISSVMEGMLAALTDTSSVLTKLEALKKKSAGAKETSDKIVAAFNELIKIFQSLDKAANSIKTSMAGLAKLKAMADDVNMEDFAKVINEAVDKQIKNLTSSVKKKVKTDAGYVPNDVGKQGNVRGRMESRIEQLTDPNSKAQLKEELSFLNSEVDAYLAKTTKTAEEWNTLVQLTGLLSGNIDEAEKKQEQMVALAEKIASLQDKYGDLAGVVAGTKDSYKKLDASAIANVEQIRATNEEYQKQLGFVDKLQALYDNDPSQENVEALQDGVAGLVSLYTRLNEQVEVYARKTAVEKKTKDVGNKYTEYADKFDTTAKMRGQQAELEDLLKKADAAKQTLDKSWSTENVKTYYDVLDKLQKKLEEIEESTKQAQYKQDDSLEAQYNKIGGLIARLDERKTSFVQNAGRQINLFSNEKENIVSDVPAAEEAIKFLDNFREKLAGISKENYQVKIPEIINEMKDSAIEAGVPLTQLSDVMEILRVKLSGAQEAINTFNGERKDARNMNSWVKSIQNTLYTARRYLENNTKIFTDPEMHAKFMNFLEPYEQLMKSRELTQKEAQALASQITKEWSDLKRGAQDAGLETDKLSDKLKKLFEVNVKSQLANQAINAFRRGLQQVYQNVVQIDTAMTELKKVTEESSATYDRFLSEAGERAKKLGIGISDVVNATADFARLGYNLKEATQISDSAVMFKQVGDGVQSMDDATSDIISAMKAFNIEADKSLTITDRFNEVGNNFSITSAGVAEALKRSASSLHTAGNDIDQSIGMIVAANNVVQDPDSVGAGLRVIALRIRGAKTELESIGEETDTVVESTAKLRKEIQAIAGVDIMESDNSTFKSTYAILDELSDKWEQLTDIQKATLTQDLAGKNRANIFSSMMENWQDARAAMEASKESAGSATSELNTYLDSVQGHLSRFQATFQAFSNDVLDSEVIKFFIDLGTAALNAADGLVKTGEALPLLAAGFSGIGTLTGNTAGAEMPFYATGIAA